MTDKAEAKPTTTTRRKGVRYSEKLVDAICARLAKGEIWTDVSEEEGMPSYGALYQWRDKHPYCAEALRKSRDMAADSAADEMIKVARAATAATATADRLRVGALQWAAGKAAPHRYGSRADATPEPLAVVVEVRVKRYEKLFREDGTAYLREIMTDDGR